MDADHPGSGVLIARRSTAFRNAEAAVPCVLFIDEIDSFSSRSRGSESHDYMRGVVNGLLMHLSRASATPGLILLAATNDLSVIDPAVIRPGRFDLKIPVLNPDRIGVRDILADNLTIDGSTLLTEAELDAISIELVGASGATVAAAAREALSRARAAGRALSLDDLRAVVQTQRSAVTAEYLRRLAVHEAGHVIVRTLSSLPPPHTVRIGEGVAAVTSYGLPFLTPQTAEEVLQELLAGRAAERVVLGQISSGAGEGAASDLAQATSLALKMETEWSFSPGAKVWQPVSALMMLNLPTELKASVEERLAAAEQAAETCLRQNLDSLLRLTDLLLERREITGEALIAVLSDLGFRKDRDTHVSAAFG